MNLGCWANERAKEGMARSQARREAHHHLHLGQQGQEQLDEITETREINIPSDGDSPGTETPNTDGMLQLLRMANPKAREETTNETATTIQNIRNHNHSWEEEQQRKAKVLELNRRFKKLRKEGKSSEEAMAIINGGNNNNDNDDDVGNHKDGNDINKTENYEEDDGKHKHNEHDGKKKEDN